MSHDCSFSITPLQLLYGFRKRVEDTPHQHISFPSDLLGNTNFKDPWFERSGCYTIRSIQIVVCFVLFFAIYLMEVVQAISAKKADQALLGFNC